MAPPRSDPDARFFKVAAILVSGVLLLSWIVTFMHHVSAGVCLTSPHLPAIGDLPIGTSKGQLPPIGTAAHQLTSVYI